MPSKESVQVTFSLPAREHELIARIAGLQGRSVEEYALRAIRTVAEGAVNEFVGTVMGYKVGNNHLFDEDTGLIAELPPEEGGAA